MVTHDDAVTQIVEEQFERLRFLHPLPALIAGHAMHGDRFGIALHLEQGRERVLEDDLAVDHGHRADRDDAVRRRVQPGGLGVEHDEAHAIDRRVIAPRLLEASAIAAAGTRGSITGSRATRDPR